MPDSVLTTQLHSVTAEGICAREDQLAVEEPLEINLLHYREGERQRKSIAVTMRTPGHDVELALGFLHSEGIVTRIEDVTASQHSGSAALRGDGSNVVTIALHPRLAVDLDRLQRHFYTSSSCGVCGKASLEALETVGASCLPDAGFVISANTLHQLALAASGDQAWFQQTGGLHAAAVFAEDGSVACMREDIGRHNAVDKVVGHLLQQSALPAHSCGLFVSGRASFELMQKAVMAGIPLLAAVGAPSSLAVELAREYNMTLVGFLRDGRFNIYAGADRIQV